MPNTSPLGGISLVIHILINVLVFVYKKLLSLFKISNNNLVSNTFDKITSRDGETIVRSILSYSIILVIFFTMTGNILFIYFSINHDQVLKKLSEKAKTSLTSSISLITGEQDIKYIDNVKNDSKKIEDLNIHTLDEIIKSAESMKLIDFMNSIGINDISFDNRAEIAIKLGVVKEKNEYKGSLSQNQKIKEGLVNVLIANQSINKIIE